MKNPKYSIIIPSSSNTEGLYNCIASILKYTDLHDVEIIVVYNTDKKLFSIFDALYSDVKVLTFDNKLGYARAVNEGIKESKGEYVILLNDDCVLLEQENNKWIDVLTEPFLKFKNIGVSAPMVAKCKELNLDYAVFFCAMISRELIDTIGTLDESLWSYYEDLDYCIRAEIAGFKTIQVCSQNARFESKMLVGGFPIYHEGGKTHRDVPGIDDLIKNNYYKVIDRHLSYDEKSQQAYHKKFATTLFIEKGKEENFVKLSEWVDKSVVDKGYEMKGVNIERAKRINGFMLDTELRWLAERAQGAKVFIELGSWLGRSTNAIASNLPDDGVLYCLDTWKGSVQEEVLTTQAAQMQGDYAFFQFVKNNADLIQKGKIIPLRMEGKNAFVLLEEMGIKADVVFIDADHSYEGVTKDIHNSYSVIKEGGILCGHDFSNDWEGVKRAVFNEFGNKGFEVAVDTSIWWRKIYINNIDVIETRVGGGDE